MANAIPYPMFLKVDQQPVLVVGGGAVGLRKAKGLLESGARVTVVSVNFAAGFEELADIERVRGRYAATHMSRKQWRLVFAATDSGEVNELVQRHAAAAGILCCRCDEPELGDFSGGATARVGGAGGGGVTVAVSTAGASPRLAGRICRGAVEGVDPVLVALSGLLSGWRARVKKEVGDGVARRELLIRAAGEEMEVMLRESGEVEAERLFARWLAAASQGDAEFLSHGVRAGQGPGGGQVAGEEAEDA